MITVRVNASRDYDIHIGPGLRIKPFCPGAVCAVVTDDIVDALYARALEKSLRKSGLRCVKFVFSNGESGKKNIVNKWSFYLFYPIHFLALWLILKA